MDTKKILSKKLETLIEKKKDENYKNSVPQQAEDMGIPYPTFAKYLSGMSECPAKNLIKIANYYGVSIDFLLGNTHIETTNPTIQAVGQYTGLSDKAIETLKFLNDRKNIRAYIDLLSCIIASSNFEYLLGLLEGYISPNRESISAEFSMSRADINYKDLCIFAASNAMRSILDDVRDEFLKGFKTTDERLEEYTEEKLKAKEGGVNASVQK